MLRPDFPKTIFEFQQRFPDDEACVKFLVQSRWPEGFACPGCGRDAVVVNTIGWRHEICYNARIVATKYRQRPARLWIDPRCRSGSGFTPRI
jgi:hypothetical protein